MCPVFCAGTLVISLLTLSWTGAALDCMFFSAFEYAQAALIWLRLSPVQRALGKQHWLYRRYFDRWHALLLAVRFISLLMFPAQALMLVARSVWQIIDILYLLAAVTAAAVWLFSRVIGRDGRRYTEYNAFAPLHERFLKEIRRQRNALEPTAALRRMDFTGPVGAEALSSEVRKNTAERYIRW